ncbi:hypothetical protein ACFPFP_41965 [Bradyrhizobium sp. GCM10023182]|uniref:Uncharacterized protein n=1 Tax=Bradyrhizobium zhengyangense TaxID=2911009 RepID=A0ABS9M2A0_9BRAD|nr:hypothetical protein [Bradyrhizobium zhengyangense]MCG2673394.1 hypothetical protein [Bradyrhizobium zhengyangense]
MISNNSGSRSKPGTYCARMKNRAVRADFSASLNVDRALMRNKGAGADLGVDIYLYVRDHLHELPHNI